MIEKLWGSRFKKEMDPEILGFSSSISYDKKLALYDIEGNIAHAKMLGACNIIPKAESALLVKGLEKLKNKLSHGKLAIDETKYEDIHSAINFLLKKEIGNTADKLHTARSRNDQVALDVRMYSKDAITGISGKINDLQICFLKGAKKFSDKAITMPSYTHLKNAQCILLSHQLLAYIEMLERDKERLHDVFKRVDILPLGSVAHRGSTLPIDRFYVAKLLGFSKVSDNSIDSVSDRDFAIELISDLAILSMHLSRIAEDFIIWSSDEFGFVEGDDAHYTGSSMMPNKKNPDPFELIRGYSGKVYGDLVSIMVMMKGLPLTYDRDMQLDKLSLFEAVDTMNKVLPILKKVLYGIKINEEKLKKASLNESIYAADISEYLVTQGYATNNAHKIAGEIILYALSKGRLIKHMSDEELKKFSHKLNKRIVNDLIDPIKSVSRVKSYGGTQPKSVVRQIAKWEKRLRKPA
ncbi:MAG: argininosuccinate lyase [Candidatus Omnitrophica bacterium]|nr:argininosuccinate lyase [Candidatus Omnitrophota bacterium]MDD5236462.1 argininosuccinate lyase [Candidatus Omnitrophota bacterium]MDD5610473.1 argininosuccinate lyase [Candidatus Omnitrophota bacterium]